MYKNFTYENSCILLIGRIRYRIKRSEFIGYVHDCNNINEMNTIVSDYKRRFYDARNVCYAVIFDNNEIFNEDKEPSGTSGTMILNELKRRLLRNKLVIIVRYFGGIKLGRELLRETYLNVAILALNKIQKL